MMRIGLSILLAGAGVACAENTASFRGPAPVGVIVNRYCLDCHDRDAHKGGVDLESISGDRLEDHSDIWERVVHRLATRQMPPVSRQSRPTEPEYEAAVSGLAGVLDAEAKLHPRPGRTETIRRLNRAEYQNAIRDLLALDIDVATLLPADDASHGFDNVTVGTLSPTLLDRYISAAQKISRLALGRAARAPGGDTIRVRPDITQEDRLEGLPFGTRGGTLIHYVFPQDGEYEIAVRLSRDRNDDVEGLREPHELLVLLDREQLQSFIVRPPGTNQSQDRADAHLKCRLNIKAGARELGVTFLKNPTSLLETKRQPYQAHFNFHRHPRIGPAIYQVSITGPFNASGPGEIPSRRRLLVARPKSVEDEEPCARSILSTVLRRAWRRPVNDNDVERILPFFREGRKNGGFDGGLEAALSAVLVSREFLFRVEPDPAPATPGSVYRINDLELATRLSFFLWSSLPDDELLALAEAGKLSQSNVLAKQTRRMLADARASSLVGNFAAQWLHLRNLDSFTPDGRLFPDFDDNLRQALRRETEMLFAEIISQDRSVLDLLKSDHAWLNERLARHYGIPCVYGPHFRRVSLDSESHRGGLLRQASVLTVTSYATRTSPVLRGKWILENLLGTPPPPPLPDVPALDDSTVAASLPVRERLAAHRNRPACVGCHEFIDPPGFALENFDALGRWRTREEEKPVDASGGLPDGRTFTGVDALENGLLARPDNFVRTLSAKLLTFALGRGVTATDGPALREIVRQARTDEYRFSAVIVGLVQSAPFIMKESL